MHGTYEKYIQNFGQKLDWKRPLGRTKRRWKGDEYVKLWTRFVYIS
jgi:hypothetical protein